MSSSESAKACATRHYIEQRGLAIDFLCPQLSNYPGQALARLEDLLQRHGTRQVGLIGSSLGGFYATWLSQTYQVPAVLINPAVAPQKLLANYLGENTNPYTGQHFVLTEDHLQQFREFDIDPLTAPELLLLMLQMGDETLDYRQALDKYAAARQIVEPGGNHRFLGYDRHLPTILDFLLCRKAPTARLK